MIFKHASGYLHRAQPLSVQLCLLLLLLPLSVLLLRLPLLCCLLLLARVLLLGSKMFKKFHVIHAVSRSKKQV
jgi:hypothetical protein